MLGQWRPLPFLSLRMAAQLNIITFFLPIASQQRKGENVGSLVTAQRRQRRHSFLFFFNVRLRVLYVISPGWVLSFALFFSWID